MLSSVLKKEKCKECKNCCVFYSSSRWEMPEVSRDNADEIRRFFKCEDSVTEIDGKYKMNGVLRENICEKSEEYRCPALDENKGCVLPSELKPIECSMWPVRVMNDNEKIYICLASSCHAADDNFKNDIISLLNCRLKKDIIEIVIKDKNVVKKYNKSYEKLMEITKDIDINE